MTDLPSNLAHSLVSRLVLGVRYDTPDMIWYPIGIALLAALHHLLSMRHTRRHGS
jgi:hypothetical protein